MDGEMGRIEQGPLIYDRHPFIFMFMFTTSHLQSRDVSVLFSPASFSRKKLCNFCDVSRIWCAWVLIMLLLGGFQTASAFDAATRSTAYWAWMNTFFHTNSSGEPVFRNQEGGNGSTSFWRGAEEIEVVEDAVVAGVDTTNHVVQLCTSYLHDNSSNWSWNTYNDDIMWARRAFIRAYQLTGNTSYLYTAQANWDIAFNRGWCFSCGGGLYQDTGSGASFRTCGNAPGADAAFMLYTNLNGLRSTNTYYLGRAQLMYNWMVSGVAEPAYNSSNGGVEEGPDDPNVYFTYDDGAFSEIALWLGDTAKGVS